MRISNPTVRSTLVLAIVVVGVAFFWGKYVDKHDATHKLLQMEEVGSP